MLCSVARTKCGSRAAMFTSAPTASGSSFLSSQFFPCPTMKAEEAAGSQLAHTLTSSIGGSQTDPKVTRFDVDWGHVLLLCSDGLTRHVTDDRIRDVLRSMTSAKQACETLLQDALDDGGTDNITVIVGRAVPRGREAA